MSIFDEIKNSVKDVTLDDVMYEAKRVACDALDFAADHKEGLAVCALVAPAAYEIGRKMVKDIKHDSNDKRERCQYWDRRTMHMWETRRPLTNRELMELDYRVKRGEHMGKILSDMRVLR